MMESPETHVFNGSPPSRPRHRIGCPRPLAFAALVLLPACLPMIAAAQDPAPPVGGTELTLDSVQARIEQLEQATDLDAGLKTKLIETYNQTAELLRAAENWAAQASEYTRAGQEAPSRLAEIKSELSAPRLDAAPNVPDDSTLQQLEQLLAQGEAELTALETTAASLADEKSRRTQRRATVPEELAAAASKLEEVNAELGAPPLADEPPLLAEARRTQLAARKQAIERERACYLTELQSYDARSELLTARRDLAASRVARKEESVALWREVVNERRRVEADRAAYEARNAARREALLGRPVVRRVAEKNAELAKRRSDSMVVDKIEKATTTLDATEKLRSRLEGEYKSLQDRIRIAGLTRAMGLLLRNRLDALPDVREYERRRARRQAELVDVQVELLGFEEQRDDLSDLEARVREAMSELDDAVNEHERSEIETAVRDLFEQRRQYLDSLIGDFRAHFDSLSDLDFAETKLIHRVEASRGYIEEHILWVPSTSLPTSRDVGRLTSAIGWFLSPDNWRTVISAFRAGVRERWTLTASATPPVLVLLVSVIWLRRRLRALGDVAERGTTATILPTLNALLITVVLGVRWAVVLWFLAWFLTVPLEVGPFATAVAAGLRATAVFWAAGASLRCLCRPQGLADAHLDLPENSLRSVRRHLVGVLVLTLPLVFVVATVEAFSDNDAGASLGRLAFIVIHVVLLVFAVRVLRPMSTIIREAMHAHAGSWIDRMRYVWAPLTIGVPSLLIVLAIAGYYYTAYQLAILAQKTLWIVIGLTVLDAILLRWILVARRKLAIEQYRKRRAAAARAEAAHKAGEGGAGETAAAELAEPELDLSVIGAQTRTLVRSLVGFGLILGLWVVWADVLPALNMLERVPLWTTTETVTGTVAAGAGDATGSTETVERIVAVTLADVGFAAIVVLIMTIALRNLPGLLEIAILQHLPLQAGTRYAVTTLSRYAITVIGLVIAFGAIGINWGKVQWLAAAITVGLGFGLQEIFANFVSGLILLFERPIRIGDIVTVGDTVGRVTRIRMRATTIMDWDRRELLVPNKDFITGQLINWTLSDTVARVMIPVGVAYGSDTQLVHDLLVKTAGEHPLIMDDPAPRAVFRAFGDSTLNFELYFYIPTRDYWFDVIHQMHTGIDQAFRKAGIEIAFPQQDLHIRSIQDSVRVTHRGDRDVLERTV